MRRLHIYLVDDNKDLQVTISENLVAEGYDVTQIFSAAELLDRLESLAPDSGPDAILLDLILPDANGLNLINKIHEYTDSPILVISGKGQLVDKIVGLEIGADDYIGKPFEIRELLARLKAHIRRNKNQNKAVPENNAPLHFGKWTLDPHQIQVFNDDGDSAELTVKEYRLLEALVQAPDRVLSREQLLANSRQGDADVFDRTIDIQITRIRKKIGDDASGDGAIKTIRGAGYMFVSDKNRKKD